MLRIHTLHTKNIVLFSFPSYTNCHWHVLCLCRVVLSCDATLLSRPGLEKNVFLLLLTKTGTAIWQGQIAPNESFMTNKCNLISVTFFVSWPPAGVWRLRIANGKHIGSLHLCNLTSVTHANDANSKGLFEAAVLMSTALLRIFLSLSFLIKKVSLIVRAVDNHVRVSTICSLNSPPVITIIQWALFSLPKRKK